MCRFVVGDEIEWLLPPCKGADTLRATQVVSGVLVDVHGEFAKVEVIDPASLRPVIYTVLLTELRRRELRHP
jgi:hypothetical protein